MTASETANAGFVVERAAGPAGAFADLGFVPGAGTTDAPRTYAFTDAALPPSLALRYRLRQLDTGGTATPSPVVEVAPQAAPLALAAPYPHPLTPGRAAALRYTLPTAGNATVAVYDVLGRRVQVLATGRHAAGAHTLRLDAAGLASGAYLVRLTTATAVQTRRVTVVR